MKGKVCREWLDAALASRKKKLSGKTKSICLCAITSIFLTTNAFSKNLVAEAYASFVQSMAHSVTNNYQEMMNTTLETKRIEFNGQVVTYQYQLWRLRPQSVCANYQHDLIAYSQCGKKAQKLFIQTCKHLNENPSSHWKHSKLTNLYCAASVDYRPVVAEVGISTQQNDAEREAKQRCSVLRMQALQTRDARTIQIRDQICGGLK